MGKVHFGCYDDYLIHEPNGVWHFPVKDNGVLDHRKMRQCYAGLTSGYRGYKYEGPQRKAALRRLKKLYQQEGLDWPGRTRWARSGM